MRKSLTKRQALYLVTICFLANKTQRLPGLISSTVGRNGWLVILILGLLDVAFLSLTLLVNKINNKRTLYGMCEVAGGKVFASFVLITFGLYFLLNTILPYEAVHDVFSNVLFAHLPWEFYSIFLVFAVAFLACYGLTVMGRMSELTLWLIATSFVVLLFFGTMSTDFSRVLPIYDINAKTLFSTCFDYSLWFGDFTLIYLFMGRVKEDDGKMGWCFIVSITVCVALLCYGYTIFYGLYENLAPAQINFISSISRFSLLNLDIGRIDWFFVLFFEVSTFFSSAVYIYAASRCICEVFKIKNEKIVTIAIVLAVYVTDILVFKNVGQGAEKLTKFAKYTYPLIIIAFPIMLLIVALVVRKKDNKQKKLMGQMYKYAELYNTQKFEKPRLSYKDLSVSDKQPNLTLLKTKKRKKGGNHA